MVGIVDIPPESHPTITSYSMLPPLYVDQPPPPYPPDSRADKYDNYQTIEMAPPPVVPGKLPLSIFIFIFRYDNI